MGSMEYTPGMENGLIDRAVRDITEQKQSEEMHKQLKEALEYDKLRSEFFANLFLTKLNTPQDDIQCRAASLPSI